MTELAIGLGAGLGSTLVSVILFFVLLHNSGGRQDRADARARKLELELDERTADRDARAANEQILHGNLDELLLEISDIKTSNQTLAAKLAVVSKARDDLERVLQDHPGALPAALHAALEQLRAQMPAAAPAPAAADPARREADPVHGADDLEHP